MIPRDDENARWPLPGLQELRETTVEPDWNAIEERLLGAFAATAAAANSADATRHPVRLRWRWLAAAAAVVLAAAITFSPATGRLGTPAVRPADSAAPPTPPVSTTTAPALPQPAQPQGGTAAPIRERGRVDRTRAAAPRASESVFDDFVALPGAFALPDFESGRIVRVEVPLTVLPAYGIDLAADAPAAVEADFLIGQDGVPRAIRLATSSQRQ